MRVALALIIAALVAAVPVVAQQMQPHTLSTPDTLKWAEPPTFPGARLAVVHGNPAQEARSCTA